ncbi:oligosaccharide flippase family protein [Pseudomonas sp. NFACC04-2]|uniref:oligosaccharide flippase family protein n=1 Tax=Pseudomonas sp. NFACC04-2 TaxID=1566242 RepID=UPI000908917A|nr:lipopolysaccharide biosynthesis protein [Pseudomonas sp. NFACC04-2]SFW63493.1 Membrane protein involved in the export of O-antigen and teichoic acid [Pseudomonas sp. NFACC04-2]
MSAIFIQRVARVLVGTLGAQLITIGVTLLLVRLYSPAEMGDFSAWLSFATIFAVMVTGRYELAIFATKAENDFHAVIKLVLLLTLSITILVAGGLVLAAPFMDALPAVVGDYWLALAIVSLGLGANKLVLSLLTFQQSFNRLGGARISLAACVAVAQVSAAYLLGGVSGLIYGQLFGVIVATALAAIWVGKPLIVACAATPWRAVRQSAVKYINFPKFSLPADLINTVASQIPIVLLAAKFGGESAGWFALTLKIMGAPISLLAASVLDVFKEQAARDYRETGSCRGIFIKTFKLLAVLALPPFVAFWFVGEWAFSFIFGAAWAESGRYAVLMIPLFYMRFVVSPLSYTIYIAQRQNLDLVWQLTLLALTFACFTLPDTVDSVLWFYSMGYAIMYFIYFWMSFYCTKGDAK